MQVDGELDAFDRRASLLGLIAVRAGEAILAVRAKPSRRKATSKNLAVWAMMGVIDYQFESVNPSLTSRRIQVRSLSLR